MIITLKGADFSASNIGQLTAWRIRTDLGEGATYDGPTSVEKGLPLNATVTVDEAYNLGTVSVTMAGVAVTDSYTIEGNVVTINIAEVIGTVVITVATASASGIEWLDLPVTKYALGVTSTGTGRVSSNNAKRFSTADDTKANGILIRAGETMHLKGLASGTYPLRADYIYGTENVACPSSGSTTAIEGLVGTASNYVASNYFPLNTTGEDTLDIVNTYGADYYFWIGFAGQTLNEGILAEFETYDIKYHIS